MSAVDPVAGSAAGSGSCWSSSVPSSPDVFVSLDAASPTRLGELATLIDDAGVSVVIDHHASNPGFGDVRLSFSLGLSLGVLGWGEAVIGFFLGFFYGAVIGMILIVARRRKAKQEIPFGPFLVAGTLTAILVGAPIVDWYLGR